MQTPSRWSLLKWQCRLTGVRGVATDLAVRMGRKLGNAPIDDRFYDRRDSVFDRALGISTVGMRSVSEMEIPEDRRGHAVEYRSIAAAEVAAAIDALPLTSAERSAASFVDLGCGKGRAMVVAHRFGFAAVKGVELEPTLAEQACTNLAAVSPGPIDGEAAWEVTNGDATRFVFPRTPLVVYLFNPFSDEVLRPVLQNLEADLAEHPRPCQILYANAVHSDIFGEEWAGSVSDDGWWAHFVWSRFTTPRPVADVESRVLAGVA